MKYFYILCALLEYSQCLYSATVLLTGGAGFIGSHLAIRLLERGDTVIIIDNFNNAYDPRFKRANIAHLKTKSINNQLRIFEFDIRNIDALQDVFVQEKPDLVCHLAARAGVRPSMEMPHEYIETNIVGTLNILECVRKYGIKHVVMASSSSVYGNPNKAPFHELQPADKQNSPYGVTKRAGELFAYNYHYLYGISVTCLRFFTVYGPRGRVDMAPFIFLDAIEQGKPIKLCGNGSIIRDFTYVEDIVDGIVQSLDNPQGFAIFNLGRGEPITLSEFINTIECITGKEAQVQQVPTFAADVSYTHADITHARDCIGYQPRISIHEGMTRMYEWYMREYVPLYKEITAQI